MNNYDRFVKTINWELPDRLLTYDVIDHRELLEQFGGEGDLVERNARMASRIGLDVTRYVYDPDNHWMGAKIQNWIRFFRRGSEKLGNRAGRRDFLDFPAAVPRSGRPGEEHAQPAQEE